jgi:hypothetical protein
MAEEWTLTVRPARPSKTKRFGENWMFPSKTRPTTSASVLMTGLPELPPIDVVDGHEVQRSGEVQAALLGTGAGHETGDLVADIRW